MMMNKKDMTVAQAIADYRKDVEDWRKYHGLNPHVYVEFARDADRLVELGVTGKPSPWGLMRSLEALRDKDMCIIRLREEFALPNTFIAFYSRHYMTERKHIHIHPFFDIKAMIGENHNAVRVRCGYEPREDWPVAEEFEDEASAWLDRLWVDFRRAAKAK